MASLQKILGIWVLTPDRARYDYGAPPQSGTYEILEQNDLLTFKMEWVDSLGNTQTMEYAEVCDGQFHDYPVKDYADEICLKLVRDDLLVSVARKDSEIILTAKREVIQRSLLRVSMSGQDPDGNAYKNISWYIKSP